MDFYFDDIPSTSQTLPKNGHCHSGQKEENGHDPAGDKSLFVSRTDIGEKQTSSIIDEISRKVQALVEKINDSRTSDQRVMDSFQDELMTKVTEVCQEMKESMYTVYEDNSTEMHVKLEELSKVLESCTRLHQELAEATQALSGLRVSISINKQE